MSFSSIFGTLAFLNPWVLAGFIFLPALWFLLRVTPPAPHLMIFPPARFLANLIPDTPTRSRTPWWILLLRLLTLALIIVALAKPVLNPGSNLPGKGPVRLVIDNSWAAAQTWQQQSETAQNIIELAGRENREIYIMTTAPKPDADKPSYQGPLAQGQALSILRGLTPHPWAADYDSAIKQVKDTQPKQSIDTYWLSHGLKEGKTDLIKLLQNQGALHFIGPKNSRLPLLIRPDNKISSQLSVLLSAPKALPPGTPVTVHAIDANERVLDAQNIKLDVREKSAEITFDLPNTVRNQIQKIRIAGRNGAGALVLLDDQFKRRSVGIVTPSGESEETPLIEESFYLERALQPYANIMVGSVQTLIEKKPSVIIMPNVGAIPPNELNALEHWIKNGGFLLRFAGPNMTQGENFLTPVPILQGGRALDGALTWNEPVKLAPFPERSPFYGLNLNDEIKVRRQLLAQPIAGLEQKTWAALEDGTPLVTADTLGDGMLVLIHTTATPLWSDLSLSGLFIQMLRRIIALSGTHGTQKTTDGQMNPILTLDGFGKLIQPPNTVHPIASNDFENTDPGPLHPPGFYGQTGYQRALNLGNHIGALETFSSLPSGVEQSFYGQQHEKNLLPFFLSVAFLLFLADWFLMMLLQYSWRLVRPVTAPLCLALILFSFPAYAKSEKEIVAYASNIHLAYIRSGNAMIDRTTSEGLTVLSETLSRRTSVEPGGVVGLDPEKDELSFFPLLYWPIAQDQPNLSSKALENIQYYIDHGGTILIDTRDQLSNTNAGFGLSGGRNAAKLRSLVSGLNIPPLSPIKENHVLGRSFYLLDSFPGRYEGGTLWIEEQSTNGRDGVSPVIIGGNDWAAAWAGSKSTGVRLGGGPQQQEMALRFGVNLVMYALTGNYKADQVHLPHILERLGQ